MEENPLNRCLKGVIRCEGWMKDSLFHCLNVGSVYQQDGPPPPYQEEGGGGLVITVGGLTGGRKGGLDS